MSMPGAQPTLRQWLAQEPFGLVMSSGFFSFFAHAGVLSVLEDEGLLPARVSGSSAGALVTGAWAAGLSAEALGEELLRLERADFWDPAPGLGLLAGRLFRSKLEALLPVATFAECRVPSAMSAFHIASGQTRVLDRGPLAPAITASCAVPGLFHPVDIDGARYWDGGIFDRPGTLGMPKGQRVLYHHILSRSPWRRRNSPALKIPHRSHLAAVVIQDLPRVGPFRLREGRIALAKARDEMRRALEQPVFSDLAVA